MSESKPQAPRWARWLARADRCVWYAYHAHEIVRDELLFAWLDPVHRASLTNEAYAGARTYAPGGETFEGSLFTWERELLGLPEIPSSGRVLLGGAGGGRELLALARRGYEVCAFEPNPALLAGARRVCADLASASVLEGSYGDLVRAVRYSQGPLQSLRGPFDLVYLGWGSLTHLTDRIEQLELLESLRTLAPQAPVLASFFLRRGQAEAAVSRSQRARRVIRSVLSALGRARQVPDGLGYERWGGFVYSFGEAEFRALARRAGYAVSHFRDTPFPHAVLEPCGRAKAPGPPHRSA